MSYNRKQKHRFKFTQLSKSNRQERGFKDLESEIRNRLGMNQASNIWRTVENTKRVTVYRTGGIYNGYKY